MYDVKTLPGTPGMARRLLSIGQLNGMIFDENVVALLELDLLDHQDHVRLSVQELASLQFVQDWLGRAMILCDDLALGRKIASEHIKLSLGQCLIVTRPENYGFWAQDIIKVAPHATISIFGDPKFFQNVGPLPGNLEPVDVPNIQADFLITSYSSVIWHNLVSKTSPSYSIFDEFSSFDFQRNNVRGSTLKGLFRELPRPLILQDINSLQLQLGLDHLQSLQARDSWAIKTVASKVINLLWAGMETPSLLIKMATEAAKYLADRNYNDVDNLKLLEVFGVSSHTLKASTQG